MKLLNKLFILIIICFTLIMLQACKTNKNENLKIVATIFPQYDITKEIIKGTTNVDLECIITSGIDFHSYQATIEEIAKIKACDLLIYVGGESDEWVEDVIKTTNNKSMKVINLLDVLEDKVLEEVEFEEEHDHDEHEHEVDEHCFLSIKNAIIFTNKISQVLCEIDKDNQSIYEKNTIDYRNKLDELDKAYETSIKKCPRNIVLFGDRFPFAYLFNDYNLTYHAAFSGCSAETEASFATIARLVKVVDELNLKKIAIIDNGNKSIAQTIINNSKDKNQSIISLNSMQAITKKDICEGVSFISIMEENLTSLISLLQ